MLWEPGEHKYNKRFFDLYCIRCDLYYNSKSSDKYGSKYIGTMSRRTGIMIRRERNLRKEFLTIQPTKEQNELEQELKSNRQQTIIPDKAFHDLFCRTLKEVTERECTCYGKDIKSTQ
jgi:hypothetical protein